MAGSANSGIGTRFEQLLLQKCESAAWQILSNLRAIELDGGIGRVRTAMSETWTLPTMNGYGRSAISRPTCPQGCRDPGRQRPASPSLAPAAAARW